MTQHQIRNILDFVSQAVSAEQSSAAVDDAQAHGWVRLPVNFSFINRAVSHTGPGNQLVDL